MSTTAEILRTEANGHNPKSPAAQRPDYCKWLVRPRNGRGYLQINDQCYMLSEREFTYENGWGGRLFTLRQPDGTEYQVVLDRDGDLTCSCPDAVYRHEGKNCKHCRAIVAAYRWLEERQQLETALQLMYQTEAPF